MYFIFEGDMQGYYIIRRVYMGYINVLTFFFIVYLSFVCLV